jgi:anti-anti-sigma regulatory factor
MASSHDVYDDGVLRVTSTASPPMVVITGEIDESNYSGLVGALDMLANGRDEVHINLGGVNFCDLAGLRAIIRLAETGPGAHDRPGPRLVLHAVPRQVLRVLQIVGWDTMPGLVIEPSSPPAG